MLMKCFISVVLNRVKEMAGNCTVHWLLMTLVCHSGRRGSFHLNVSCSFTKYDTVDLIMCTVFGSLATKKSKNREIQYVPTT
ncbi:hypothetical protein AOLI_G00165480, partial [Acnodon oligacanthus]